MATKLAEGYVDVRARLDGLQRDLGEVHSMVANKMRDIASIAGGVGLERVFSRITSHVRESISALIDTPAQFDTFQASLAVMLKSERAAAALIEDIKKMASATPFEISGLIAAAQQLKMYGFEVNQLLPMLHKIGDAASASPGGMAFGLERISRAIGQMKASGSVKAGDMRQLTEVGVPAWDILAKGMGVSVGKAMDMAGKGLVSAEKGIEIILNGMGERFDGMMAKQSKTFLGQTSNFADNMTRLHERVGRPLTELATKALTTFNTAFETEAAQAMIERMRGRMQDLVDTIKEVTAKGVAWYEQNREMIPVAIELAGTFTKVASSVLGVAQAANMLKIAMAGLAANPIFLIAAAAGLAAAAYAKWQKEIDGFIAGNAAIQRMIVYVRGVAEAVKGGLAQAWGVARDAAGRFWGWLTERFNENKTAIFSMGQSFVDVWLNIVDFARAAMAKISELFKQVFDADFVKVLNATVQEVVEFFATLMDQISLFTSTFSEGVNGLGDLWQKFSDMMVMVFAEAMKGVVNLWIAAASEISDWILKNASEGGAFGKMALAGTGVNMQEEVARDGDAKAMGAMEARIAELREIKKTSGFDVTRVRGEMVLIDDEIKRIEKIIGQGQRSQQMRDGGIGGDNTTLEDAQADARKQLGQQADAAKAAIDESRKNAEERQVELRAKRDKIRQDRATAAEKDAARQRVKHVFEQTNRLAKWAGGRLNPNAIGQMLGNANNQAGGLLVAAKKQLAGLLGGDKKAAEDAGDGDSGNKKTAFLAFNELNKQIQLSLSEKKDNANEKLLAIAVEDKKEKAAFRKKVGEGIDQLALGAKAQ